MRIRFEMQEYVIKQDCVKTPYFYRGKIASDFTDICSKVTQNTVKLQELSRK